MAGKTMNSSTQFLTVGQLAARWQMSERHIRRVLASGDLAATHLGRSVRISLQAVLAYEATHSGPLLAGQVIPRLGLRRGE